MKPIIGIIGKVRKSEDNTTMISSVEDIRRVVIRKGGIPFLILPTQDIDYENDKSKLTEEEIKDIKVIVDLCDGIIIPGGCVLYDYDKVIYEYAIEKDIPVIGICAGMQLIAINDKNEEVEKVLDKIESNIEHQSPDADYVHSVNIKKGTHLYDIIGKETINVNSRHSYKVKSVNSLAISAISEDGIIEGIERTDKKFVIGIQWHPENMCTYDEDANKIFDRFMEACFK